MCGEGCHLPVSSVVRLGSTIRHSFLTMTYNTHLSIFFLREISAEANGWNSGPKTGAFYLALCGAPRGVYGRPTRGRVRMYFNDYAYVDCSNLFSIQMKLRDVWELRKLLTTYL